MEPIGLVRVDLSFRHVLPDPRKAYLRLWRYCAGAVFLSQSKSGLRSAPRMPQAVKSLACAKNPKSPAMKPHVIRPWGEPAQ